jgi:protoporphyrinogen/coproporphyrinogen III oxidase
MAGSGATAVIGAGISGLGAARRIKQSGRDVVVFEAEDRVGGRIQTIHRGDLTFDVGAFIYLGSYDGCVDTIKEVGLEPQMGRFDAYGAMPRDGELNFLDLSKPVRTVLGTKYVSTRSKLKLAKLMTLLGRRWRDLNYEDASGVAEIDVDTVTTYAERELNPEILDYIAAVVVRGPWLSDPSYASVGQLLWTLKNFFKPYFYGLDDGMDALPRAIASDLEVKLGCPVVNVTDFGDGVEVTYTENGKEHTEWFDSAVITLTAGPSIDVYPQMAGAQRDYYAATEYIASVNTHLALSRRPENPATYIMCSPREQPDLCGVIVDHLKARNRCPDEMGMLTVFCRHEWCLEHLEASDDEIIEQVLRFLEPYYGDLGPDLADHEIGRWREVVPIMSKGRFKDVDSFLRSIDPAARVQFAGDLVSPIPGVNASLLSGFAAGERIASVPRRTSKPSPVGVGN